MEAWLSDKHLVPGTFSRVDAIDAATFTFLEVGDGGMSLRVVGPPFHSKATSSNSSSSGSDDEMPQPQPCIDVLIWAFDSRQRLTTVGCGLSHLKAIAMAYAAGLQEVLIMEDDVAPIDLLGDSGNGNGGEGWRGEANAAMVWTYLRAMIDSLPADWTLLQVRFPAIRFAEPPHAYRMCCAHDTVCTMPWRLCRCLHRLTHIAAQALLAHTSSRSQGRSISSH